VVEIRWGVVSLRADLMLMAMHPLQLLLMAELQFHHLAGMCCGASTWPPLAGKNSNRHPLNVLQAPATLPPHCLIKAQSGTTRVTPYFCGLKHSRDWFCIMIKGQFSCN
jgi:hypothetical protein